MFGLQACLTGPATGDVWRRRGGEWWIDGGKVVDRKCRESLLDRMRDLSYPQSSMECRGLPYSRDETRGGAGSSWHTGWILGSGVLLSEKRWVTRLKSSGFILQKQPCIRSSKPLSLGWDLARFSKARERRGQRQGIDVGRGLGRLDIHSYGWFNCAGT